MSATLLSLIMDFLLLGALSTMIFFALKLSKNLENFRKHRKEFKAVVDDLNKNIERAYETLATLKENSMSSSLNLEKYVLRAEDMVEELMLINKASERLANRLEDLGASRQSRGGSRAHHDRGVGDTETKDYDEALYNNIVSMEKSVSELVQAEEEEAPPSFFIQDREFEDHAGLDAEGPVQSEAERELLEALAKNRQHGSH